VIARRSLLFAAVLVGCGSSSEPSQHAPAEIPISSEYDAGPPPQPKRTMKSVPLFGDTPIYNLLIDPTFDDGNPGIGRWYSNLGTSLNAEGPHVAQAILSASPSGISLPVGMVADVPEGGKPRAFSLLAQLPGGTGPYVVSLWVSSDKPLGAPVTDWVRVGVASATGTGGIGGVEVPLDPEQQKTINGRIWHRFQGEIAGPFALGAFITLRFKASRTQWWLQAPVVVPKGLLAPAETKSLKRAWPIELDAEERAGIAAYRRIPLDYGVGKP